VRLAQALGVPVSRIAGWVNAARRVLNMDEVQVRSLDQLSGKIILDLPLLRRHFELGDAP
jgi:hypothetical protein